MKLLFFVLIPSVCVFLGIVNILYNSLMVNKLLNLLTSALCSLLYNLESVQS